MKSHLTEAELEALQHSGLDREAPFIITGVCDSQFSISRHFGGCRAYHRQYAYIPPTDELIRYDVVKWLAQFRKDLVKKKRVEAEKLQGKLF